MALTFAFAVALYVTFSDAQVFAAANVRPPGAELRRQIPTDTEWNWGVIAAWVQAIGSVVAIGFAVWIGHRNHKHSEHVFEEERKREEGIRHLRAHSLAHAIYPELIEVKIMIAAVENGMDNQIEARGGLSPALSPVEKMSRDWKISIPAGFQSTRELFYLFGTNTTPVISELLSLLHQHNRVVDRLVAQLNNEETFGKAFVKFQSNELFHNRFRIMKDDAEQAVKLIGEIRDRELLPEYIMKTDDHH